MLHAFVTGFISFEIQGHMADDREEIDRNFDTAIHLIIHGLTGLACVGKSNPPRVGLVFQLPRRGRDA
ncbi:hypothetical protein ACFLIM_23455 [Nonomuraea sp. M3C6]|uniref:Uncharacterized protein n=1 Tax=Nonomuraea marmarensis TaxID=3351344 RepID=A0ABW7AGE5_9ACTN